MSIIPFTDKNTYIWRCQTGGRNACERIVFDISKCSEPGLLRPLPAYLSDVPHLVPRSFAPPLDTINSRFLHIPGTQVGGDHLS